NGVSRDSANTRDRDSDRTRRHASSDLEHDDAAGVHADALWARGRVGWRADAQPFDNFTPVRNSKRRSSDVRCRGMSTHSRRRVCVFDPIIERDWNSPNVDSTQGVMTDDRSRILKTLVPDVVLY